MILNLFYKNYKKVTIVSENTMMKINQLIFTCFVVNIKKPHNIKYAALKLFICIA